MTMPVAVRVRRAWTDMPPPQRVNRMLYALAAVSLAALLVELGVGTRSSDVDVAGGPTSTAPRPLASTVPAAPSTTLDAAPATTGGVSLADIVAQVAASPGGAEETSASARRSPLPTSPAARATQPSSGGSGAGSSPAAGGGGGSSPAAAPPAQAAPEPEPDPPDTSPSSTVTTPTTRAVRSAPTFDVPDFTFSDRDREDTIRRGRR